MNLARKLFTLWFGIALATQMACWVPYSALAEEARDFPMSSDVVPVDEYRDVEPSSMLDEIVSADGGESEMGDESTQVEGSEPVSEAGAAEGVASNSVDATDMVDVSAAQNEALESDMGMTQTEVATSDEPTDVAEDLVLEPQASGSPYISYQAHVQNVGWQKTVRDGAVAGTSGRSLRIEAIKITVSGGALSGGVEYRMHVQNVGWQNWTRDGGLGGTTGRSLRVEAFQVRLYGELAEKYDVWYRAHVQNVGWMAWTRNGACVGSSGRSLRMEALQICLVPKGEVPTLAQSDVSYAYVGEVEPSQAVLEVATHIQNVGWKSFPGSGVVAGTTGQGLRLEAIEIRLGDTGTSGGIRYQAHVQNVGWQGWCSDGETAGTEGKSLRVEAIKIELTGAMAEKFDVYYRSHVQSIGWMAWTCNGRTSGSVGLGLRVEAVQVKLVRKGSAAPGDGGSYRGAAVDASVQKPRNMTVGIVADLQHGFKPPCYQRCIVIHDTTEVRPFSYWPGLWRSRGGVSVQFMIKMDGSIRQYVDMNQIAWHAGSPTNGGIDRRYGVVRYTDSGSAMNQCSIGIELEHVIDGSDYPKAQLDALDELIGYIDDYYGFPSTILQHKDYQDSSPDCSAEFQRYLKNLQDHRTTR